MPYRSLDPDNIIKTLTRLRSRIAERFPDRGIAQVCAELLAIAIEDKERARKMARRNYWIAAGVWVSLGLGVVGLGLVLRQVRLDINGAEALSLFQGVEAVLNVVVLAGAAVWFLLNLESRWRREQILGDLHELRSIAHVIDMHQLTKDPTTILSKGSTTTSSPVREENEFLLTRYLEYCSEMLSVTGKLAALYAQGVRDPTIIDAVNDIEDLTGNLSRKIWQKIMILNRLEDRSSA
ncbi:hypothetical protein GC169_13410 [bacterium]|nr:hypothetical protein [bacterium]